MSLKAGLALVGGILGLFLTVGGIIATTDSRYENKEYARDQYELKHYVREQLAQMDQRQRLAEQQIAYSRINQLDQQILYWESQRRFRRLTLDEENLLLRLRRERQGICAQWRIAC